MITIVSLKYFTLSCVGRCDYIWIWYTRFCKGLKLN